MQFRHYRNAVLILLTASTIVSAQPPAAQTPSAEYILKQFRPAITGVKYDTPTAEELKSCNVEIERGKGTAGFVVYGPTGQVLRRFTDITGEGKPDLFRYYQLGLEVYRAIDTDKNNKPDQHRWMNWGGMRWGIDSDEDGKIESWKILSAQEAAQIAVEAMIQGDAAALKSVMINADDIRAIKASAAVSKELLKTAADPAAALKVVMGKSTSLTSQSKWVRFDPPVPSLVPKEDGKAGVDLIVYENAMGIVENGGTHELVSIGEMIKVGEVWKLSQIPTPLDANNAQVQIGGILMEPELLAGGLNAPPEMTKEMEDLLKQLEQLDNNSPTANATPKDLATFNRQRADVIEKVIRFVPTEKERLQWLQQFADGVAAAVQTGHYDAGLQRLVLLQEQVKANKELHGYVSYRRLLAEYAVRSKQDDEATHQKTQDWWLKQLEGYARQWPDSDDTADAIVQLAISFEFMGRLEDAKRWYGVLISNHPQKRAGIRARGALRRLDLAGKPLQLAGKSLAGQPISAASYRGKVTLVVFWASWAQAYTESLPKLVAAHQKYQRLGFEVLGVNLDSDAAGIPGYIAKNGGSQWQHLRDPEGAEGKLSSDFGIVTVPTMFLVDKSGLVAGGVTPESLDSAVQLLLQGKPLQSPNAQNAATRPQPRN